MCQIVGLLKGEHVISTKSKAELGVGNNGKRACADDSNYQERKDLLQAGNYSRCFLCVNIDKHVS